ncbi:zinc-dependent alcohol dehydrogenase [Budvicia aquatica]|uniref:Dehydrogenase n=1 Tax=Budvicia aquatica TaxID=82979 RepID=A0A2C6DFX4_9GAMM|nr:alcohol dehydrogenase catalytic domain-containing protein [Budvicia aquatica]PHI28107.1 dehydrogenase [Budvicia aquatica]
MKAIVYHGPKEISLDDVPVPEINQDEVLIKVHYAGICGSDLNIYVGAHPRAKSPLITGHEFSGVIAKGNGHFKEGTPVTVRPLISCQHCAPCENGVSHVCSSLKLYGIDTAGGMAEYVKVPANVVHQLPADMPMTIGAFVEPLAVAVHAVSRTNFNVGDSVVVFGAGTIGLCMASVLQAGGAKQIIVVETNPYRLQLASELGFIALNPAEIDITARVSELTKGIGADVVYDCAAHPVVAALLTKVVKVQGMIEIVGSYKKPAEFQLLDIEFKELTVIGTRVYTKRDFNTAINLISKGFPYERLITVYSPEQAKDGFDMCLNGGDVIKVMYEFV